MEIKSISDSEWLVMEVLWDHYPSTAREIIEALTGEKNWSPKTIKTLLSRLVKKNIISFSQEGRSYKYKPLVKRDDIEKTERLSFLKKVYRGSVNPMLAAFIKESKMSPKEISELRSLLDSKEKEMEK